MAAERVRTGSSVGRLAALVGAYGRRVLPAVLDQHREGSVSSALGVWLLLAACASAAQGSDRAALEEALGCSAEDAAGLLAAFMAAPPPALEAALAVWVAVDDATVELASWEQRLPRQVESGSMPSQAEADAWAERETLGLIRNFPLEIDELTRIVLASALATKVSWEVPFGVVPAAEHLGRSSPWRSSLARLLWDGRPDERAMIARTGSAGVVAVQVAVAREDLTVVSVSGAPEVDRASVLAGAYEVAAAVGGDGDWGRLACSLYDLP
ncbi:MAG: serpin family protein, partial [Solirubrobacteraceae bacterium]